MRRIIEIMWLAISAVSLVELVKGYLNTGFKNENFKLFTILFTAATFMYFFRKRQRIKDEERKKNIP